MRKIIAATAIFLTAGGGASHAGCYCNATVKDSGSCAAPEYQVVGNYSATGVALTTGTANLTCTGP